MAAKSYMKLPRVGRAAIRRSLQHLNSEKVLLKDNVKAVEVKVGKTAGTSYGVRYFCYDKLPQLKFHNPHVKFSRTNGSMSQILILLDDGNMENLKIQLNDPDEILQYIRKEYGIENGTVPNERISNMSSPTKDSGTPSTTDDDAASA